jgi:hypothetical protein
LSSSGLGAGAAEAVTAGAGATGSGAGAGAGAGVTGGGASPQAEVRRREPRTVERRSALRIDDVATSPARGMRAGGSAR